MTLIERIEILNIIVGIGLVPIRTNKRRGAITALFWVCPGNVRAGQRICPYIWDTDNA
jgi:hypothetical protein